METANNETW